MPVSLAETSSTRSAASYAGAGTTASPSPGSSPAASASPRSCGRTCCACTGGPGARTSNTAARADAGRPSTNGRADTSGAAGASPGGRTRCACAGGPSARTSAAADRPGSMSVSDANGETVPVCVSDANGQTVPVTNPNSQAVSMSHADP
jgi:hypothetical protein